MNKNGSYQKDGEWWVDAKARTGVAGTFGPFGTEDEADSAASYVFVCWIQDGVMPPNDAALAAPRDIDLAEAVRRLALGD
jgi:hypothetical protein